MGILTRFLGSSDSDNSKSLAEIEKEFRVADCASCNSCDGSSIPPNEQYPKSLFIDTSSPLWGSIKPWSMQILCATGKTDWVHSVTDESGTLAQAIDHSTKTLSKYLVNPSTGKPQNSPRVMVSNSSLPPPDEYLEFDETTHDIKDRPSRVLILPEFVFIEQITPKSAAQDLEAVAKAFQKARVEALQKIDKDDYSLVTNKPHIPALSREAVLANLGQTSTQDATLPSGHKVIPATDIAYILLCSHRTRDKRCAVTANILKKHFETELRERDLYRDSSDDRPDGVHLYMISHVGGHKFAANCIIYTKSGTAIWLARVRPEHVPNIIDHCVMKGQVFPELLRGAFNTNPISW